MKIVTWLVVLAALGMGGKWLYDNGYFAKWQEQFNNSSFKHSMDNTVQRTEDFATDKAVKEADFEKDFK